MERQASWTCSAQAVATSRRPGHGDGVSDVLVLGEAGVGKTSLVQAVWSRRPGRARVARRRVQDMLTPRALGTLRTRPRRRGRTLAPALSPEVIPN